MSSANTCHYIKQLKVKQCLTQSVCITCWILYSQFCLFLFQSNFTSVQVILKQRCSILLWQRQIHYCNFSFKFNVWTQRQIVVLAVTIKESCRFCNTNPYVDWLPFCFFCIRVIPRRLLNKSYDIKNYFQKSHFLNGCPQLAQLAT